MAAAIVAVVLPGAALSDLGDPIELKITYHNVTCTQVGSNLSCSGKISGLGNAAQTVRIDITATRQCTNVGGNEPPGQVKGQSSPLPVRNGSVTFSNVTTQAKACPDKMTPTFIGPATVCVVAVSGTLPGGETSHCEQVPIT
ncbi:MAG TPA: hypothetical protein VI503_07665 [Gaiellaceae bacterium]|nr:hypothetical protein [Gaiellaceae bacterium]